MTLIISQILDDAPDGASGVVNGQTIGDSTPGVLVQLSGAESAAGGSLTLYDLAPDGSRTALQTVNVAAGATTALFRPAALAEGGHLLQVAAGGALSDTFALRVDLTPDAAPLLSEVRDDVAPDGAGQSVGYNGSWMINDPTPVLRVSLAGANAGEGDVLKLVSRQPTVVEFDHTVTAGEAQAGYVDLTPTLADGWYQFQAQLVHVDGSFVGLSSVRGLREDTTAPTAPQITAVADDAGSATGQLASGASTDDTTPTVTVAFDLEQPATAGSPGHNPYPVSSTIGGTVELFANGALVATAQAAAGPATLTASQLAAGHYDLTARIVDVAGNVSAESAAFSLTVGAPAAAGGGAPGEVLTSHQYADTLTGGAGADTLNAGQGPDQLTGGAGADSFAFANLPWNAGHVTDFTVGADRLDLSALFQASGYTGGDPIADGYVSLASDGAGGTEVLYDTDGAAAGNTIQFRITDLDHVATGGLTWAQLADGAPAASGPAGGSGAATTAGGATGATGGQALTSSQYADTLSGGAGDDTLNAGQGPDRLTGGGGHDAFVFGALPWNAGHVTDFTPGSDVLDLRALFQASAYAGANPLADGWLAFRDDGAGDTQVYMDSDGPSGGQWPTLITTLDHVAPAQIGAGDWLFH